MLGFTRVLAVKQGRHDGIGGCHATKLVGEDRRSISRRSLGVAQCCQAGQARNQLDGIVKRGLGGIGPSCPNPVTDTVIRFGFSWRRVWGSSDRRASAAGRT